MWRSRCHKPTIWDALSLPSVGHLGTVSCWVYHMKSAWIICSKSPKEQPLATPRESQVPTVCGPRSCQRSKPVDDLWVDRVIARPTSRNVKCLWLVMQLIVYTYECKQINIYIYIYRIWILIYTYIYIHICVWCSNYIYLYIYRHTCSQTYVMLRYVNSFFILCYVMLCMCVCIVCVYIHTYALIHIYTYMCVYIYIHMGIFSLLGIICSDDVVSFAGPEIWEAMWNSGRFAWPSYLRC